MSIRCGGNNKGFLINDNECKYNCPDMPPEPSQGEFWHNTYDGKIYIWHEEV